MASGRILDVGVEDPESATSRMWVWMWASSSGYFCNTGGYSHKSTSQSLSIKMAKATPIKSAPKVKSVGKSPGGKVPLLDKFKAKRAARKLAMASGSVTKPGVDAGGSSGTTQREVVALWQHKAKKRASFWSQRKKLQQKSAWAPHLSSRKH